MKKSVIQAEFFQDYTPKVDRKPQVFLVREYRGKMIRRTIIETEAYRGEYDLASHASRSKTPKTKTMYEKTGHAYIYLIYGMFIVDVLKLTFF